MLVEAMLIKESKYQWAIFKIKKVNMPHIKRDHNANMPTQIYTILK